MNSIKSAICWCFSGPWCKEQGADFNSCLNFSSNIGSELKLRLEASLDGSTNSICSFWDGWSQKCMLDIEDLSGK